MIEDVIEKIKEQVSIYDLLKRDNITVVTRRFPCQIKCPFHGADLDASARVYPDTNMVSCFTCNETWDVIDYWTKSNEWYKDNGTLDRGKAIHALASEYGITFEAAQWRSKLNKFLNQHASAQRSYAEHSGQERLDTKLLYSVKLSELVSLIPIENRETSWSIVDPIWNSLDIVPLDGDEWRDNLLSWYLDSSSKVRAYHE